MALCWGIRRVYPSVGRDEDAMRFRRETDWGEFKRSDPDELSRAFRRKPEWADP